MGYTVVEKFERAFDAVLGEMREFADQVMQRR